MKINLILALLFSLFSQRSCSFCFFALRVFSLHPLVAALLLMYLGPFAMGSLKGRKFVTNQYVVIATILVYLLWLWNGKEHRPLSVFSMFCITHTHLVHMCDDVWSDISSYNGLCVVVLSVWSGCVNIPPCDPCTAHVCSDNNLCVLMGHTEHDRIHEDVALLSFKCGSKSARRVLLVWKRTVIMYWWCLMCIFLSRFSHLLVSCNASADKC